MPDSTLKLLPFADISSYTEGFNIVSVQWGHDGLAYLLLINKVPERIQDMFVQTKLNESYTYKVLIISDQQVKEVVIRRQHFHYHYVQPLQEHLLLVGARCTYYREGQFDLNAKVCDMEGTTIREFLLGDGIQSVQVTERGTIWTSYFDEGIFGNYGWNEPIGANGLLAWDAYGHVIYKNTVADIYDCYALNVVNEQEVWFYYYSDFRLGCVSGEVGSEQVDVTFANPQLSGSSGFCTDGYHFLFDAGYGKHGTFILKKMQKPGSLTKGTKISLRNEKNRPFQQPWQDLRQDRLLLSEGNLLYQITMEEMLAVIG
ncbi:MAG: hypothetical protein IKE29_18355 [Paenibacillus sp.]|uniref:hypothetical protein n=1 Tax=Paenibacillus sp. TaxID=58172 RepID=UPI0025E9AB81|nr:hypothetical protein [Paenibacillus sp.]MBR2566560.1 hypothetical protein [Paenibacillus sp.]